MMTENHELDPPKQALKRAAEVLGGQANLARLCELGSRSDVWQFINDPRRTWPAEYCPDVEKATRERAKELGDSSLIVTCEQLRPDVSWGVLRSKTARAA